MSILTFETDKELSRRREIQLSRSIEEHDSLKDYVRLCSNSPSLKERSTWWFLETYLSESELSYGLSKANHWAYIVHDKDNCEPHTHILLHYENARSGNAVLRDYVGRQNTFARKVLSLPIICYEYLYHLNDPDKYQYDKSLIVSDNPVYWEHFIPSIRDRTVEFTNADFIEDLLNEKIDIVEMAKKYGRDFIRNYKTYLDFRVEVFVRSKFN